MKYEIDFEHNPVILNNFLLYLTNAKNYSKCTIKAYELDLKMFFNFLIQYKALKTTYLKISIFSLLSVGTDDILAFLVYLNYHRANCAYTRQRKLCAIKTFFKWLLISNPGVQKENPTKEIPDIEPCLRIPRYLSLEKAKNIQHVFTLENSKTPIRNNTIITLFLTTGMRASELIGVNIKDIDFENKTIGIYGKGGKQRIVYFNENCKIQLKKYLDIRERDKKNKDKDALFISLQHRRIGIDGIEDVCKKAYKLMGLENYGYTTHTLRHTAATTMYRYVSQDILLIKKFLGHVRISTTEIYTHTYNEKVKEAVDKNPLNNFEEKESEQKVA